MHVDDELRLAKRLGPKPGEARHVEPLERRIDSDALAPRQPALESHRLSVHEDDVDLGMRHSQRLDEVFDGARSEKPMTEALLSPLARQEMIELLVEPELDFFVLHRLPVGTSLSGFFFSQEARDPTL